MLITSPTKPGPFVGNILIARIDARADLSAVKKLPRVAERPGPDYATGYGRINVAAALEQLRA